MAIEIDIRTRILPDDHAIYLLFPGQAYKYSDFMLDNKIVFIDLPLIPHEIWHENGKFVKEKLTDEIIAVSILAKRYQKLTTPLTQEEYIEQNINNLISQPKRFSVQKAAFLNFHTVPKAGDIVVIPGPLYKSPVLIGEFVSEPGDIEYYGLPDETYFSVPARRVRWLAAPEKQTLPGSLVGRLPSSNPFRRLEMSEYKTIYDVGYGSYKHKDLYVSQFHFDQAVLKGDTTLFMGLFIYYIAKIYDSKNPQVDISTIDTDFIDRVIGEFEQRININSPGQYVFSRRNITPLIISAALAAFAAGGFSASTGVFDVNVTNSLQKDAAADAVNLKIEDEIKRQWSNMNGDNLDRISKSAKKMTEGGVTPRARKKKN